MAALRYFRGKGYSATVEPIGFEYPSTPTMRCRRGRSTLLVEAAIAVSFDTVDAWLAYAKSRSESTYIGFLVAEPPGVTHDVMVGLKQRNVGLFSFGDGRIVELLPPQDLTVAVQLPSLDTLKPTVAKLIRPCFEKIERGEWLDGFRDSCQVLEVLAAKHLKDGVKRGRITFRNKGGAAVSYSSQRIAKLTQGGLANAFSEIVTPIQTDVIFQKALSSTNPDRVMAVHKTARARNSARIRATIGQHLWTIVSALRQVL
ncbi:hypothetical protein J2T07_003758 [Luteibacter jiangsuensis]|uniref:Uncharacterized protein n=1 Tax=Luteibacter jiangsuensis TaxID=637577 RepID=A0ABT9T3V7_9GAMM|nr:hypothetical protein [Luteibacter jiangsuensis]MDQ0011544.1 hypothetical protein [Luteibacter jiangsuensis]